LSHFSAIYIAKTGFTADRNPFKTDDWYKIECSKIFEKPEELPLEPRPVANGGAKVTAIALGLTLPLMEGEPTTYFASRLAARNFLKARPFAADMGYTALD
jgi:hypothetical protein